MAEAQFNPNSFKARAADEISAFFNEVDASLCRTQEEVSAAFDQFNMKMLDGVVFHLSRQLNNAANKLAVVILDMVGSPRGSASQLKDKMFRVYADLVLDEVQPNLDNYSSALAIALAEFMKVEFNYVGPCNVFRFEGAAQLISAHVSVLPAANFLAQSEIPRQGKNWTLKEGPAFDDYVESDTFVTAIGGYCWDIRTQCAKDNVRVEAAHMANVFISLIRLALTPSDYCHRAKNGQVEQPPNGEGRYRSVGVVYSEATTYAGGRHRATEYKVSARFAEEFSSVEFQSKLDAVFQRKSGGSANV